MLAATNTSEHGVDAAMPSARAIERYRRLFATGKKVDGPAPRPAVKGSKGPDGSDSELLSEILGKSVKAAKGPNDKQVTPRLIRGRFFIYRYESREAYPTQSRAFTVQAPAEVQTPGYEKGTEGTGLCRVATPSVAAGGKLDSGPSLVSRRRAGLSGCRTKAAA